MPITLGVPFTITVHGNNFDPAATVTLAGPGTTLNSATVINSNTIELSVTYSLDASDSTQTITVANPDGQSDSESYTVGTLSG